MAELMRIYTYAFYDGIMSKLIVQSAFLLMLYLLKIKCYSLCDVHFLTDKHVFANISKIIKIGRVSSSV